MTRRNIELILLCVAAPLVVLPFAMLAINEGQALNETTLGVPVGIFVAFVVAHLAVRKWAKDADPAILPLTFAISGIGITFVTRLAPDLAMRQVMWLFLGVFCMVLVLIFVRNVDKLANYKYTLLLLGLLLFLSPLLPGIGHEEYGSRIWLKLGSFSFQPGELAKILIVLFLAGYLAQNREMLSVFTWRLGPFRLPDIRTLLPLLVMWVLAMLIVVFEKDLGSALVLFFLFLIMLYISSGKKFYLVIGLGLATIAAIGLYFMFSHVQTRVNIWLDPFKDASGSGYQLVQSLYSIADGGLFGTGIGRGLSENIPVVESDFIFTAIAEEAGLLGAAGLLLLYLCFSIRGFVTAARAKSDVSSLVAVGLTSTIVLQAFIIVGGVTRLIPLTGITLPFVSQGGSSLLASFISVGFLLRCGDEGTGVGKELANATSTTLGENSVLGRVSLGKRLTHGMLIFSAMFALLVANLTMIMVVQADYYKNLPSNNHTMAREAKTQRGTISTYDGTILAQSVQNSDGSYSRIYPAKTLASHVVGYSSTKYGTSGIEASLNNTLKGQQSFANWTDLVNYLAGINTPGNDVVLTLNSTVQQAAQDALSNEVGACVVMDPETGAVLAMASSPTYDASDVENVIASAAGTSSSSAGSRAGGDSSSSSDSGTSSSTSISESSSELYNRATQALYAPGSTFKMLTLATAFENKTASENTQYDAPGQMEIGNAAVTNSKNIGYGTISLSRATEVSSNTVYGQLGVQIGAKTLVDSAKKFGFNTTLDFDLDVATSLMPDADEMTEWETAWAAAGEPVGEHESPAGPQATVLEMALVGCAIGNDGAIMQPYLVDGIYNANGERSFTGTPKKLSQAVSADTANRVKSVLEGVVNNGTGAAAAIEGVQVAGKTGTAERGDGSADSWFVGMAPADNPRVVVAIAIEKGDSGEGASKAQNVLKTALEVQGLL